MKEKNLKILFNKLECFSKCLTSGSLKLELIQGFNQSVFFRVKLSFTCLYWVFVCIIQTLLVPYPNVYTSLRPLDTLYHLLWALWILGVLQYLHLVRSHSLTSSVVLIKESSSYQPFLQEIHIQILEMVSHEVDIHKGLKDWFT